MSSPVLVVLNPASSNGRAARLRGRIEEILNDLEISFDLQLTRGPGHASELARRAAAGGVEVVVAVGGDGTVHEVAGGLLERAGSDDGSGTGISGESGERFRTDGDTPAVAVVPVGTGNDFHRMIGGSRKPEAALRVLTRGRRRLFDVGIARWDAGCRPFVNLLGVGVDVEVLHRRERFGRLTGLAQYMAALLAALVTYRPVPLRVRLDGREEITGASHLAAVTVGPSAGGGFLLNPDATPDDGRLDLCFVEALSHLQVALHLPRIARGRHRDLDVVRLRRFRRARVERDDGEPLSFQLDGELIESSARWIEIHVEPSLLPVLVPEEAESARGSPRGARSGEETG